jgi:hypothetical protein
VQAPAAGYVPGRSVAIAGQRTWLLVDAELAAERVGGLWPLVRDGADPLDVLEHLAAQGLRETPTFALVHQVEGGILAVVRGGCTATVVTDAGQSTLSAVEAMTWSEAQWDGAVKRIELDTAETGGSTGELPLSAGVVQAARLILDFTPVTVPAPRTPAPERVRSPARSVPSRPEPPRVAPPPEPTPPVTEVVTGRGRVSEETLVGFESTAGRPELEEAPVTPVADTPRQEPQQEQTEEGYGFLFGETVDRNVEEAAIRRAEEASESRPEEPSPERDREVPAERLAPPPPLPTPPRVARPAAPRVTAASPANGLIDSVPWLVSDTPDVEPAASGPEATADAGHAEDDDDFGMTVSRQAVAEHLQRAQAVPAAPGRPAVQATVCPAGHPNPPHMVTCRSCGRPVPEQDPVMVERPVLGLLRISTGDDVTLDRGVIMGRNPSPNRMVGGERPHQVKLASPSKDISREHLEIRLDGWQILITDLDSTNGTVVTLPGRAPERLKPGVASHLEPGAEISVGDEVTFTLEEDG